MASFRFLMFAKPLLLASNRTSELLDLIDGEGGIRIVAIERRQVSRDLIEQHYAASATKSFFPDLVNYYTGKEVLLIVCEAENDECLESLRTWIGHSSIEENSVRDFLVHDLYADWTALYGPFDNGVHCSDSRENGEKELQLWGLSEVPVSRLQILFPHTP